MGCRIDPSWELFLGPAGAPQLVYQGRGMNPVCGMVHVKYPLLLMGKN